MTDNILHTNLTDWLKQFPAPKVEEVKVKQPELTSAEKDVARYFGFNPDELTIVYDEDGMTAALLDGGVLLRFIWTQGAGTHPYAACVNGRYANLAFNPQDLASRIRDQLHINERLQRLQEIEAQKAKDYANRARVMQFKGRAFNEEDNRQLAILCNTEDWSVLTAHVEPATAYTSINIVYILTRE